MKPSCTSRRLTRSFACSCFALVLVAGCPKDPPPQVDAGPEGGVVPDAGPTSDGAEAGPAGGGEVGHAEVDEAEVGGGEAGAEAGPDTGTPAALKVLTGALPLYHLPKNIMNAKPRNDASGVVFLPEAKQILVIDDGGEDATPDVVPFYLTGVANLFAPPPVPLAELPAAELSTSLPAQHRDLEAAATAGGFVYVMSSLPAVTEKPEPGNRSFSRFKLVDGQIGQGTTIDPREAILAAVTTPTSDPWFADWLARWKDLKAKDGGFQVEALSATAAPGKLLVGLRSPHYAAEYLLPRMDDPTKKNTRVGPAMLVEIDVTTFAATQLAARVFANVDLGGLGFRGLEYAPAAQGYFITAGAVEAGFDYKFLFWNGQPGAAPVDLSEKIPEWKKLCRPESVSQIEHEGKPYLLVLSEESGAICEQPPAPYNYLLIALDDAFLGLLRRQ